MIKGVAFDLEGTVVDVERAHHEAHLKVAKECGVHLTLEEAKFTIKHFIGGPDDKIAEEIYELGNKKMSPKEILALDKKYYQVFLKTIKIVPRKGFVEFLKTVKIKGISTSIGSLTSRDEALFLLEKSGLNKLFDKNSIVLREDVKNVKPAPDVFLETAKRMNVNSRDQLVFEDSPRGIMAGVTAGSKTIGMPVYTDESSSKALREAGANKIFYSWEDIDLDEVTGL